MELFELLETSKKSSIITERDFTDRLLDKIDPHFFPERINDELPNLAISLSVPHTSLSKNASQEDVKNKTPVKMQDDINNPRGHIIKYAVRSKVFKPPTSQYLWKNISIQSFNQLNLSLASIMSHILRRHLKITKV